VDGAGTVTADEIILAVNLALTNFTSLTR